LENAICVVELHPSSLRLLVVRLIPQDSPAVHLIVLHRPARNTADQRAGRTGFGFTPVRVRYQMILPPPISKKILFGFGAPADGDRRAEHRRAL